MLERIVCSLRPHLPCIRISGRVSISSIGGVVASHTAFVTSLLVHLEEAAKDNLLLEPVPRGVCFRGRQVATARNKARTTRDLAGWTSLIAPRSPASIALGRYALRCNLPSPWSERAQARLNEYPSGRWSLNCSTCLPCTGPPHVPYLVLKYDEAIRRSVSMGENLTWTSTYQCQLSIASGAITV